MSTQQHPVEFINTGEEILTRNIENMQLNSDSTNVDFYGKEIR